MQLDIADRQRELAVQQGLVWRVLTMVERQEGATARLSLAVVDDERMEELNDRFLARDKTTDVLSFPYEQKDDAVEVEVVVNASEAIRRSAEHAHSAHDELLLYMVHGFLHALGYDDLEPEPADRMHDRERQLLRSADRPVQI